MNDGVWRGRFESVTARKMEVRKFGQLLRGCGGLNAVQHFQEPGGTGVPPVCSDSHGRDARATMGGA